VGRKRILKGEKKGLRQKVAADGKGGEMATFHRMRVDGRGPIPQIGADPRKGVRRVGGAHVEDEEGRTRAWDLNSGLLEILDPKE